MISIIVPVFNPKLSDFVKCLNSLDAFSRINSAEILLINDGSDDYVEETCKYFCNLNSNFKYYYKINGGVSSARNFGINVANGEYITFVDSDDIIYPLKITIDNNIFHNSMVLFSFLIKNKGKVRYKKNCFINKSYFIKISIRNNFLNGPYSKIFDISLIKREKISFNEKIIQGEDLDFVLSYLNKCTNVYNVKSFLYFYNFENQNLINRKKNMSIDDFTISFEIFYKRFSILNSNGSNFLNKKLCYYLLLDDIYKVFTTCDDKTINLFLKNFIENFNSEIFKHQKHLINLLFQKKINRFCFLFKLQSLCLNLYVKTRRKLFRNYK